MSGGADPGYLAAYRYDAAGQSVDSYTAAGSGVEVPFRYQGRILQSADGATDLYDSGARSYDPSLASFISFDTVTGSAQNPLTLNRYLYALSNPATMIDPTGHAACAGGMPPGMAEACEAAAAHSAQCYYEYGANCPGHASTGTTTAPTTSTTTSGNGGGPDGESVDPTLQFVTKAPDWEEVESQFLWQCTREVPLEICMLGWKEYNERLNDMPLGRGLVAHGDLVGVLSGSGDDLVGANGLYAQRFEAMVTYLTEEKDWPKASAVNSAKGFVDKQFEGGWGKYLRKAGKVVGAVAVGVDAGTTAMECGAADLECLGAVAETVLVDGASWAVGSAVATACITGAVAGPMGCAVAGIVAGVVTSGVLNAVIDDFTRWQPSPADYRRSIEIMKEYGPPPGFEASR